MYINCVKKMIHEHQKVQQYNLKTMTTTEQILKAFSERVRKTDSTHDLKELKDILTECYKNQNKKKTKEDKPKKAPSAYNNFVKETITKLRSEEPDTPFSELMKKAAAKWKELTKQEQESYKQM
jgi:hypothetical protein